MYLVIKGRPSGRPRTTKEKIHVGKCYFSSMHQKTQYTFLSLENRFGICGLKV
jgi:hypothetical protein